MMEIAFIKNYLSALKTYILFTHFRYKRVRNNTTIDEGNHLCNSSSNTVIKTRRNYTKPYGNNMLKVKLDFSPNNNLL